MTPWNPHDVSQCAAKVPPTATHAQCERWREALQPMIDAYIAEVEASGVENAREIYEAMQEKISEFDEQNG